MPDPTPEPRPKDDHGDDINSATSIYVGETIEGSFDTGELYDFFVIQAEAGEVYQFSITLGTLESLRLIAIDSDGKRIAGGYSDWHQLGLKATDSGPHYIRLHGYGLNGTYTLTASQVVDDHADDAEGATSATVGEAIVGIVDHDYDLDFFRFPADQGEIYRVDVRSAATDNFGFLKVFLENPDGDLLKSSTLDAETPVASIGIVAQESGHYRIGINSNFADIGKSYILTISIEQ